jgi:N-(2-amino-2-carboxyethyl)-L-glutamate synthase
MDVRLQNDDQVDEDVASSFPTPMIPVNVDIDGRIRRINLKLEGFNKFGSIKDRTAAALIDSVRSSVGLSSSLEIVESSSGNLAIAMAGRCAELGIRFRAVIDPKTPPRTVDYLLHFGATVELVDRPDKRGGYLLSRLARIRELMADDVVRRAWTNQYGNLANPYAHEYGTAPEIVRQAGRDFDAIFVAVSTGGTLAGIARYLRRVRPHVRIVAVDAAGSVVFGGPSGARRLTGIGSSQPSAFLRPWMYDHCITISDAEAFAACRALRAACSISVGGSSGAALTACMEDLRHHPEIRHPVVICPDLGCSYQDSIYNDEWIAGCGFAPGLGIAERALFSPPQPDRRRIQPARETLLSAASSAATAYARVAVGDLAG